jgi:hypothetical protein
MGILAAFAGLPLYMIQVEAANLTLPWYAPVLASFGTALVLLSLLQRRTVWRVVGLLFVLFLAAGECWALLSYSRLSPDTGRIAVRQQLPEFTAFRDDGTQFTRDDLKGEQDTILVFFRGRW